MAIIRTFDKHENNLNYVGTLSFLCAISCTIIMLRFRGFKATFHISKKKQSNLLHYDDTPGVSITGAYRINKDELFGSTNYPDPPKKITPSMVRLPPAQSGHRKDISKSTSNLVQPLNENINKTRSTPNIPEVVQESLTKTEIKDQKKLEKKNIEDQKKLEKKNLEDQKKSEKKNLEDQKKLEQKNLEDQKKLEKKNLDDQKKLEKKNLEDQKKLEKKNLEDQKKLEKKSLDEQKKLEKKLLDEQKKQAKLAKEQEKAEQLRKEREKQIQKTKPEEKAEQLRKEREKQIEKTKAKEETKSKIRAPQPQPQPQNVQAKPESATRLIPESTNTLESSISRSSGPPPYSPKENVPIVNKSDPSDNSSWDMISQHRLQVNRPVVVKSLPKQTRLDLQYKVNPTDNSDA